MARKRRKPHSYPPFKSKSDKRKEDLLDKARKTFGTTDECLTRTYILPSGELLDFTTKFCTANYEYNCHDAVAKRIIEAEYGRPANEFINQTGVIRMSNQPDGIYLQTSLINPLTQKQIETIERCACFGKRQKKLVYDFMTPDNRIVRASGTFDQPDCFSGVDKFKREFKQYKRKVIK